MDELFSYLLLFVFALMVFESVMLKSLLNETLFLSDLFGGGSELEPLEANAGAKLPDFELSEVNTANCISKSSLAGKPAAFLFFDPNSTDRISDYISYGVINSVLARCGGTMIVVFADLTEQCQAITSMFKNVDPEFYTVYFALDPNFSFAQSLGVSMMPSSVVVNELGTITKVGTLIIPEEI